ncbi:hypothetical protein V1227_18470 [Lentzea sp. DG1S-22]|uniref:hypothetical protein n=1 Tax=Lentzea sp. DG1S-22 TaxID=3108822 RepID=UPI002E75B9A5|nr:hypothetical protein [Lentzea sp. DG1S-22]WVH84643.1 hypothetical protein V1227_18470 [Lentzea sp. DG1S-22]
MITETLDAGGAEVGKGNQPQVKGELGTRGERRLTLGLTYRPNATFTIDASATSNVVAVVVV